jgi:mRNA interferase RelE/StbE
MPTWRTVWNGRSGSMLKSQGAHFNRVKRLKGSVGKRLRVGDFRVVFQESDDEIYVARIAPRGDVYD